MSAVLGKQGEGHNIGGNAPKKSNSATCAPFYKRTRYTCKPNVFLILETFPEVKIATSMVSDENCKKIIKNYKKL